MFHGKGGMTEVPKESTSAVKVCVAVRPLMPLEKKCTDIVKIPTPYKVAGSGWGGWKGRYGWKGERGAQRA
eukprot:87664-Chlamydomonas_euryale.AAC.1